MVWEEFGLFCSVVSTGFLDFLKEEDMVFIFLVYYVYGVGKFFSYVIKLYYFYVELLYVLY